MQADLRHRYSSAILAAMNEAARFYASAVELARDNGLIGQVLRQYPDWVWRAADKSAVQDSDYRIKHDDPERLPLPDPWHFLLGMRDVPERDRAVFRAAQSQLVAFRHLGRMRMGIATLDTDWHRKATQAKKSGDVARSNQAANRLANGLWQIEIVSETLREDAAQRPELLDAALKWQVQRRRQMIHRGTSDEIKGVKKWPSYEEFRDKNKLAAFLVEWWVRQGFNGAPGFMFWRNEAVAKFLQFRFKMTEPHLTPAVIKKVRQRLGLIPVSKDLHWVWNLEIKTNADGTRTIEGFQRSGVSVFKGIIPTS